MKKFLLTIGITLLSIIIFISYIYISRYYDQKILEDNFYFNCDYWGKNYQNNENDIRKINYMILTIKECKLKNQNKFLLKNLDNTSYIGTDFLSGKKFYIDQRVIETLNTVNNKNYNKEEWRKELTIN